MSLSPIEAAAVERASAAPMLANVERWAAVNSGTRNLVGCATMAGLLSDAFSVLPGAIKLVAPAPAESVGAGRNHHSARPHGDHLRVTVRPDAPVQILLTGHMDTVYPADHPFQLLDRRDANTLNGPGVADMKGGLALMLAALEAVEASPLAERIGYDVIINSDEETGSFSSAALLAEAARGKLAALTYEPALPDGTLAGARGGTGNFSIVVHGRSRPRRPQSGRRPQRDRRRRRPRDATGRREGPRPRGQPGPDRGRRPEQRRPRPRRSCASTSAPPTPPPSPARRSRSTRRSRWSPSKHDVRIELHGSFNRPPKPIDPGAAKLFATVKDAGADLGLDIAWRATGGVCDGNNIAACGVPVVDTMGARGGAIHSPDEFLLIDSLAERAALSAVTILRLAEHGL